MPNEAEYREIIGLDVETTSPELLSRMDTQLSELEAHLARFGTRFAETLTGVEGSIQRTIEQMGALSRAMAGLSAGGTVGATPTYPSYGITKAEIDRAISDYAIRSRIQRSTGEPYLNVGPGTFAPDEGPASTPRRRSPANDLSYDEYAQRYSDVTGISSTAALPEYERAISRYHDAVTRMENPVSGKLTPAPSYMTDSERRYIESLERKVNPPYVATSKEQEYVARLESEALAKRRVQAEAQIQESSNVKWWHATPAGEQLRQRLERESGTYKLSGPTLDPMRDRGPTAAEQYGLTPDLFKNPDKYPDALRKLEAAQGGVARSATEASRGAIQLGDAQERSSQRTENNSRSMFRQSFILFGLSMGVRAFIQEIEVATGEKLPPFVHALDNALQMASSFGMSGMMIGGMPGMLVGAGLGGLVGLVTALTALPPEIQELNDTLDKLASKNNAAQTLAALFDITVAEAEAVLTLAKNNVDLADSLEMVAKAKEKTQITPQNMLSVGIQWAMSGFSGKWAQDWIQEQQKTLSSPILQGQIDAAQFMQPYEKLTTQVGNAAQANSAAEALANLTGWSVKYSKSVLDNVNNDTVFAKQLDEDAKLMIAYAGSIKKATDEGQDATAAQDALATVIARVGQNAEISAGRLGILGAKAGASMGAGPQWNIGGLQVSKATQDELNRQMQIANQLADAEVAALQRAGIPTDELTSKWKNTVAQILIAGQGIEVVTGKTAALLGVAQQLMDTYSKPTVQTFPELTPDRAGKLQQYLREYEGLFQRLGVKQEAQQYLIFGDKGGLYKYTTSSEAMTVAMERLREEIKQNTDTLRGSYNIPTEFGYKPPTQWEYYASGKGDMGPVNYPWMQPGYKFGLGSTPGGAQDMPTTLAMASNALNLGLNTAATTGNTTATTQNTARLGTASASLGAAMASLGNVILGLGHAGTGLGIAGYSLGKDLGTGGVSGQLNVPYADLIAQSASKYGIKPEYLAAIVKAESGFNAGSINRTSGATGLGQVMPSDAPGYGNTFAGRPTTKQLLDPATNLDWSARILAGALQRGGGDFNQVAKGYFGSGSDAQGTSTAVAQSRYNAALNSIVSGQMRVQGIPQVQANTAGTNAHTQQMASQIPQGLMRIVSSNMTLAMQIMRQLPFLMLISQNTGKTAPAPVVNVSVPVTVIGTASVKAGTPTTTGVRGVAGVSQSGIIR